MTQKAITISTPFLRQRLLRHGLSRPRQKEPTRYRVTKAPCFHEAGHAVVAQIVGAQVLFIAV